MESTSVGYHILVVEVTFVEERGGVGLMVQKISMYYFLCFRCSFSGTVCSRCRSDCIKLNLRIIFIGSTISKCFWLNLKVDYISATRWSHVESSLEYLYNLLTLLLFFILQ